MVVKVGEQLRQAAEVVRTILNKPKDKWKAELAKINFVKQLAHNNKGFAEGSKAEFISNFNLKKPAFIIESHILGSFIDPYERFIDELAKLDVPEDKTARNKMVNLVVDAIIVLFEEEKERWDSKANLKAACKYSYIFESTSVEKKSLQETIVDCFKYLLATVAYRLENSELDKIDHGSLDYPNSVKKVEADPVYGKRVDLNPSDTQIQASEIDTYLDIKTIPKTSVDIYKFKLDRGIDRAWEDIKKSISSFKESNDAYKVYSTDELEKAELTIIKGVKLLVEDLFQHKLTRSASDAQLEVVRKKLRTFKEFIVQDRLNPNPDFTVIDALVSSLQKIIWRCSEHKLEIQNIGKKDIIEEAPSKADQFSNSKLLPFYNAPTIKSIFNQKTQFEPAKWDPNTSSLYHHISDCLEYFLKYGVHDNIQRAKAIYYVFDNEPDRKEFLERVLSKINTDKPISDEEFSEIVQRTCFIFDRENVATAETYRAYLDNERKCTQAKDEKVRRFFKRLEEYFRLAYPCSYNTPAQKRHLAKKFFNGLRDREVADKVADSKEGFRAAFEDGTPQKLLGIVEDTIWKLNTILVNKGLREDASLYAEDEKFIRKIEVEPKSVKKPAEPTPYGNERSTPNNFEERDNFQPRNFNRNRPSQEFQQKFNNQRPNYLRYPNFQRQNVQYERPNLNNDQEKFEVSAEKFRQLVDAECTRLQKNANLLPDGSFIISLAEIPLKIQERPGFNQADYEPNRKKYAILRQEAYDNIKQTYFFTPSNRPNYSSGRSFGRGNQPRRSNNWTPNNYNPNFQPKPREENQNFPSDYTPRRFNYRNRQFRNMNFNRPEQEDRPNFNAGRSKPRTKNTKYDHRL